MKGLNSLSFKTLPLIIILFLLSACAEKNDQVRRRIREHAGSVKVIDTHEHQRMPEAYGNYNFRFYHLVAASYLAADINSAGGVAVDWELIDSSSLDGLWNIYGDALNKCRSTSYYGHFVRGFNKLYGFKDSYFTRENIKPLSAEIEKNYKNYNEWFGNAFRKAGFDLMLVDKFWDPFNTDVDTNYFANAFNINTLITEARKRPSPGDSLKSIYRRAEKEGFTISNLDDYLSFCDFIIKRNIEKRTVCLKNSQAYSRTLYYEDVSREEAGVLYEKPSTSLTSSEAKKLEDFMFHWIIKEAIKYDIPVQIHTGYLAGNGNILENGEPVKLNNLFLKYPEAKFDVFHGGFPWTDEFAALGKMFPNVYLNLVWLPQISREKAVTALNVVLDCVPYNKILWGGDCGLIEESAGSLDFALDVVSEVLAERIKKGLLTEDLAYQITEAIFRDNAIKLFKLSK